MSEKLIVIGGTAAGLSAASKAKRRKPDMEIQVFEKSGYISYGACGLPYFVGGMIPEPEDLVSLTVDQMTRNRGVPTSIHTEVTAIDRENRTVTVKHLDNGQEQVHGYDKLVIATGARPVRPDIPGVDAEGVYYLRTVEDGIRLKNAVKAGTGKPAVILGGGFIGLEVAGELALSGMEVHIYEKQPGLLAFLDESISRQVLETLEGNGVQVHLGTGVEEILTLQGAVTGVRDSRGEETDAGLVLVSIGVVPNSELAKAAGLELGIRGAIAVNDRMETSDPRIYACGDCVQMKNRITGEPAYVPMGTTANKQGRIAGENAAGGHETFPGVLGSMVTRVFDLYIAATGLTVSQAEARGYQVAATVITKSDRASYYPGGRDNRLCLVADRKTGRLLGAQGAGSESIAGRINVLAAAITCGMTVGEIHRLDLVYSPSVAPVYDPILIAASQAMKQVEV